MLRTAHIAPEWVHCLSTSLLLSYSRAGAIASVLVGPANPHERLPDGMRGHAVGMTSCW